MKRKFVAFVPVALLGITLLSGCLMVSVGDHKDKDTAKAPTIQQQLNDLERARKSGAITQEQYETQRTKLLENQ